MAFALVLWFLAGAANADSPAGLRFSGRVVYRGTAAAAPGVLVQAVEAEDDGKPDEDEVLGSARADARGHFILVLTKSTDERVTLAVYAVRASAETGGDRRKEGYEIKSHRVLLGFLPDPSPAKPNVVAIERRHPGRSADRDDD